MSIGTAVVILVVLLLGNAFFVAAEFALVSARRSQLELRVAAGSRRAKTAMWALEHLSLMMAGAQLGVTVCSLGLGAIGEPAIAGQLSGPFAAIGIPHQLVHPVALALALLLVTCLHVVLGEMVPKNLSLAVPDRAAVALGPVLVTMVRTIRPVIAGLNAVANSALRLVRVRPSDEVTSVFNQDEVAVLVAESRHAKLIDADEHRLVSGALEFLDRTARQVTIPLSDVVTVPVSATGADVEELAGGTGLFRFPLAAPDGTIVGYVHLKDVLADDSERQRPIPSDSHRMLPRIPDTTPLTEVLSQLRRHRAPIALVTQGDTPAGILTVDDVLTNLIDQQPAGPEASR